MIDFESSKCYSTELSINDLLKKRVINVFEKQSKADNIREKVLTIILQMNATLKSITDS